MDGWLEKKHLCVIYPVLFDMCSDKNISVHKVWSEGWVVYFQLIPQGIIMSQWYELAAKLNRFFFKIIIRIFLCGSGMLIRLFQLSLFMTT
jgi:hypothetical protein